MTIAG